MSIGRALIKIVFLTAVAFASVTITNVGPARGEPRPDTELLAKEAYIYGYSIVDNWKAIYTFFYDPSSKLYKAPPNSLYCEASVYTPADTAVVTPNSDTPYCYALLDLRLQPMVLQVPKAPSNRYYSIQLVDLYTYNFGYIGSRATGDEAGAYLIAGPGWKGTAPKGITKAIHADTDIVVAVYRTQLFGSSDLPNVKKLQAAYKVQTLGGFAGTSVPSPSPNLSVPRYDPAKVGSPAFFNYLNALLQYMPVLPGEESLRERFTKIGVVPGKRFDLGTFSEQDQAAIKAGMTEGLKTIQAKAATVTVASDYLGARAFLNDPSGLKRAVAAQLGIYGNSAAEAFYVVYQKDANGQPLNAAKRSYTIHFRGGELPPVNAFWSVTMYDGKTRLLVANPLDRYLINSRMLPILKRDPDGGLTLYLQHGSPGELKESNWLPAPDGPMYLAMRMYWPKQSVLDGQWKAPQIQPAP